MVIIDKVDCCPRDSGIINVRVLNSPQGTDSTCSKSMEYDGVNQQFKFYCSPPALGNYLKITLKGNNVTLVLCQVIVQTIGKFPVVSFQYKSSLLELLSTWSLPWGHITKAAYSKPLRNHFLCYNYRFDAFGPRNSCSFSDCINYSFDKLLTHPSGNLMSKGRKSHNFFSSIPLRGLICPPPPLPSYPK